jgi:hypothetical protein
MMRRYSRRRKLFRYSKIAKSFYPDVPFREFIEYLKEV